MRSENQSDEIEELDRRGGTEGVTTEVGQHVCAAATIQRVHAGEDAAFDFNAVILRATLEVKAVGEGRARDLDEVVVTVHLDAAVL